MTIGREPENIRTISAIFFAGMISTPGISAASIAFSSGTITLLYHFSLAKMTVGKTACTERTAPSRASSPITSVSLRRFWSILHSSSKIPSAIGRSKLGPDFFVSAGARLTVIFVRGKGRSEFLIALRTRSRLS